MVIGDFVTKSLLKIGFILDNARKNLLILTLNAQSKTEISNGTPASP